MNGKRFSGNSIATALIVIGLILFVVCVIVIVFQDVPLQQEQNPTFVDRFKAIQAQIIQTLLGTASFILLMLFLFRYLLAKLGNETLEFIEDLQRFYLKLKNSFQNNKKE